MTLLSRLKLRAELVERLGRSGDLRLSFGQNIFCHTHLTLCGTVPYNSSIFLFTLQVVLNVRQKIGLLRCDATVVALQGQLLLTYRVLGQERHIEIRRLNSVIIQSSDLRYTNLVALHERNSTGLAPGGALISELLRHWDRLHELILLLEEL